MKKGLFFVFVLMAALMAKSASAQSESTQPENWAIEKIISAFQSQEPSEYGHKKVVVGDNSLVLSHDANYLMLLIKDTIQGTLEVFVDKFPAGTVDTNGTVLSKGAYVPYSITNHMLVAGINGETVCIYAAVSEAMMIELDFDPFFTNEVPEYQQEYGAFGSSFWQNCLIRAGAKEEDFLFSSLIEQIWSERSAAGFAGAEPIWRQISGNVEALVRINGDAIDKIGEINNIYRSRLQELAQKL